MILAMRWVVVLVALCGCDYAFRIDRIDPTVGDASGSDTIDITSDAAIDANPLPPCPPARAGIVGYYPVDGDVGSAKLTDDGPNAIHGVVVGSSISGTTGPADCGEALQIADGREITIPYSDHYQLPSGSFDLWVRPIVLSNGLLRVIVARDAGGNNQGDITLFQHRMQTGEYIFVVRLQSGDATNNGGGTIRCSNGTLTPSTSWYHVAVNFGQPTLELYVNGAPQTRTSNITINGEGMVCGQSTAGQIHTVGLDGLGEAPWFVGYGDVFEGSLKRVYLASGGIDNFRITDQRF